MCRVFGFRSVLKSQVHHSLISADNALSLQSQQHPDGWGVSYYIEGAPHVIKAESKAIDDHLFKKLSGVVTSKTVLAHIRSATLGNRHLLNTHPFQYGKWTFIHNGNIKNFSQSKSQYEQLIAPQLRSFLLGDTDSERLFYILLTHLKKAQEQNLKSILGTLKKALKQIIQISGALHNNDRGPQNENYLSFILTDGEIMIAFQGGKQLHYSTHKSKCPERNACSFFNTSCEQSTNTGSVNHLIISSEALSGENIWTALDFKGFVAVGQNMEILHDSLHSD